MDQNFQYSSSLSFAEFLYTRIPYFFRQDTHPILFPYRYIYSGSYMKAHPLYLEKFEYSPSLIFPKFSVLIISSLIKASLIKK